MPAVAAPNTNPVVQSFDKVYEQLKKVRASKTCQLKPTTMLREEIIGLDGTIQPLKIRYYQVQGIYHLLMVNRMILGDGTGLGKCVTGGTVLNTGAGLLKIQSLKPKGAKSEGFYQLDAQTSVWTGSRMAPIKSFYWGGTKPTIKLTTRNGYQIEGSLVHPVYTRLPSREGFVKLPELKIGDHVCIDRGEVPFPSEEPIIDFDLIQCARGFTYSDRLTPKLATLLGWLVSEGNRHPTSVQVTQHVSSNPDNHREIRSLFYELFGWKGNLNSKSKNELISVNSKDIRRYLISCGTKEVLSAEKCVPDLILRGTRESVRCFLSALIEAECSVASEGGIEFTTASEELAKQVQLLLLRFGVVSNRKPKRVKGYSHTYWRVNFFGDDARVFQREIGLRSKRKVAELKSSLTRTANPNKDLVPNFTSEIGALKELILEVTSKKGANQNRVGSGLKQFGECFRSTLKNILCGYRNPSYQWLQKLLDVAHSVGLSSTEEYRRVLRVTQRHFFYDPIVSIEYGSAPVMDLEVDDPEHCFAGNGLINHNTLEAIAALCYIWDRDPEMKVMVVCPKSALGQWSSEVDKFTHGIKYFIASGTLDQRKAAYLAWFKHVGPSVLVVNYHGVIRDWDQGLTKAPIPEGAKKGTQSIAGRGFLDELTSRIPRLSIIFDEVTACKNPATKTHQTCKFLSARAKRAWGLTATLLQNHLMEGFGIYKVIRPETFGTKNAFLNVYCITELQRVKGGGKIPIVVGYRNLDHFRQTIDPFFYGRAKQDVSTELPALTTREVLCELSKVEDRKYAEALEGVLELGDGEVRDYKDTKQLTSLIYIQEVCNSLALLKYGDGAGSEFEGRSAKEAALVDLLTEEFDGEKIIVYTRFASHIPRLQTILSKEGVKSVAISGSMNDKERKKSQDQFQDFNSKVKVIIITDAGSEAINLQAASAMILFDSPWSWGRYVQLLGRMIRIGSPHPRVLAVHLITRRPGLTGKKAETIDSKVVQKLRKKKGLIDQVIGEAALGALKFDRSENDIKDLLQSLREK